MNHDWTTVKDSRRCERIDREIAGTLTSEETAELDALQTAMLRYRRQVAALPLEEARQLYQELLAKESGGPH